MVNFTPTMLCDVKFLLLNRVENTKKKRVSGLRKKLFENVAGKYLKN